MRYLLVAAFLLLAPAAQARPTAAPTVVHMYGDSITKGKGYGDYDYPSFLARIDLTANVMAGRTIFVREQPLQEPQQVCRDRQRWGDDDSAVYEDAGPHPDSAAVYAAWLAAISKCDPAMTFTTMFDYNPAYDLSTYDAAFADSPLSPNDVFRQEAKAEGTMPVDWNSQMDRAWAVLEPQGVHVVDPGDGIHATVFGTILCAASLLRSEGVTRLNLGPVVDELMLQQDRIVRHNRFAPPYTRDQVAEWVDVLTRA